MSKPLIPSLLRPEDLSPSEDYRAYQEEQSKLSDTHKRVPYHQWIAEQLNLPTWPHGFSSVS